MPWEGKASGSYFANCFFVTFRGAIFCTFVLFLGPYLAHCLLFDFVGVYRPLEVCLFVCRQISHGMHLKSCSGTPWGARFDHTCKNICFDGDHSGYQGRTSLIFRLSASKTTYFRVISVEDDLFFGYQRRRRLTCELSASMMIYF